MTVDFDAIVIGSGITGGWAAKELTEQGLKTLVVERGRHIEHGGPEYTDFLSPWERRNFGLVPEPYIDRNPRIKPYQMNADNLAWFVQESEQSYSTAEGRPFQWIRSYNLGGRSLLWARKCFRMSDLDFAANANDGHGVDWPIRYRDLERWYDYVENFVGISGSHEALPQLPDSRYQPAFELTCAEEAFKRRVEKAFPGRRIIPSRVANLTAPTREQTDLGRSRCMARDYCRRGCSFGAYFSSLSATLPAAERTGNLTVLTDSICASLVYDDQRKRVSGVRIIAADSGKRSEYTAQLVFLCASAIPSAQILLNSASEAAPNGLANGSDAVGRYLSDHTGGTSASGLLHEFDDRYYSGRRPTGFYIPRYRNIHEPGDGYLRGFGVQGRALRLDWRRGARSAGIGADVKTAMRKPGPWRINLSIFGEMLPRPGNRMTLHPTRTDRWGMPMIHFDAGMSDNERRMSAQAARDLVSMLEVAGCTNIRVDQGLSNPGFRIHEFGTAVMGTDPSESVLNAYNRAHDIPNLYVTDGACMPSTGCQNPSLTYMALTARAASHAVTELRAGRL